MYNAAELEKLREKIRKIVGEKRYMHILGVERCAVRLGEKIIPGSLSELRAAALLHDVTKKLAYDEHISFIEELKFSLTDEDRATPGILHSFSAPYVIKRDFPEFATPNILSAVEKHTVGASDMSIFDKIIFVSDYAEDTRSYDSCKRVMEMLFFDFDLLDLSEAIKRLDEACLAAINGAEEALKRLGEPINSRMYNTKKSLLLN